MDKQLASVFEQSPVGMVLLTESFHVSVINAAMNELLGTHNGGSLQRYFTELFAQQHQDHVQEQLSLLAAGSSNSPLSFLLQIKGSETWVECTLHHFDSLTNKREHAYLGYFQDVTANKIATEFVDTISVDVTLMHGKAFFNNLCHYLTNKLGYEYAIVGELIEGRRVRVLGGSAEGTDIEPFEYDLAGTPCENVVGRHLCVYPNDVQHLFPRDHILVDMQAESYLGSPLFDSHGEDMGVIAIMGKKPIVNRRLAEATVSIFSERVSSEIERLRAQAKLSYQATHDPLCNIANRRAFEAEVKKALDNAKQEGTEHVMFYMDLDQFKVINDTCGHAAGDELLKQISLIISHVIDEDTVLARLGGDEFGLLLPRRNLEQAKVDAKRVLSTVYEFQFVWIDRIFRPALSIGMVAITQDTPNVEQLFKWADTACYLAKENGRNRYQIYTDSDLQTSEHENQLQWVSQLNYALKSDNFVLYAQAISPTLDHLNQQFLHYELLIRKFDAQGNLVPPNSFLPAAERYDLISQIDEWVIKKCFSMLAYSAEFIEKIGMVSINLSGQSLTSENVFGLIVNQLSQSQIPAHKICFEITETTAISKLSEATKFIEGLKAFGCRFALDDFGTGLSSFSYLKHLPVDYLKIDGEFVKDMLVDPIDKSIVESINQIGHTLEMKTIAEFVENEQIAAELKKLGVDYLQGYGIAKPEPFEDIINAHIPNLTM
jgi:diguanylate cyclase (GGDEF)-like protein/PAS domain S-box-containing protein